MNTNYLNKEKIILKAINNTSFIFNINNFSNKKACLSSLLPYDLKKKTKKNLQIALQEYKMLLEAFLNAIKAFKNGKLKKFDALVGENACQIRALRIALIAKNNSFNFSLIEEKIKKIKSLIDELLLPQNINFYMSSIISFEDLLLEKKLSFFLTEDELFLLKSYLLTEVKITNMDDKILSSLFIKETTDHKKLVNYGTISVSFLDKLVRNIRILLSYKSVEFIKKSASKHNDSYLNKILFNNDNTIEHNRLHCIPIYWSTKAMIYSILKHNIPLAIHAKFLEKSNDIFNIVDEDYLIFIPKKDENGNYSFVETSFNEIEQKNPFIVFEGIIVNEYKNIKEFKNSWKSLITSFPVSDIVLANASVHRQYPNENFDDFLHHYNDEEFNNHKIFAEKNGFSVNNPKTFFIRHVYVTSKFDKLSNKRCINLYLASFFIQNLLKYI